MVRFTLYTCFAITIRALHPLQCGVPRDCGVRLFPWVAEGLCHDSTQCQYLLALIINLLIDITCISSEATYTPHAHRVYGYPPYSFMGCVAALVLPTIPQNISKSEEGDYTYLRINFFYPGRSVYVLTSVFPLKGVPGCSPPPLS